MQKLLGFTGGNCRRIVAVRLCAGQSALKKFNCCKSRGARAPVSHNWRRRCSAAGKVTAGLAESNGSLPPGG